MFEPAMQDAGVDGGSAQEDMDSRDEACAAQPQAPAFAQPPATRRASPEAFRALTARLRGEAAPAPEQQVAPQVETFEDVPAQPEMNGVEQTQLVEQYAEPQVAPIPEFAADPPVAGQVLEDFEQSVETVPGAELVLEQQQKFVEPTTELLVETPEEPLAGMDQQAQAVGLVAEIPVAQDLQPETYADTMPPVDSVEQQVFDQGDVLLAPEPIEVPIEPRQPVEEIAIETGLADVACVDTGDQQQVVIDEAPAPFANEAVAPEEGVVHQDVTDVAQAPVAETVAPSYSDDDIDDDFELSFAVDGGDGTPGEDDAPTEELLQAAFAPLEPGTIVEQPEAAVAQEQSPDVTLLEPAPEVEAEPAPAVDVESAPAETSVFADAVMDVQPEQEAFEDPTPSQQPEQVADTVFDFDDNDIAPSPDAESVLAVEPEQPVSVQGAVDDADDIVPEPVVAERPVDVEQAIAPEMDAGLEAAVSQFADEAVEHPSVEEVAVDEVAEVATDIALDELVPEKVGEAVEAATDVDAAETVAPDATDLSQEQAEAQTDEQDVADETVSQDAITEVDLASAESEHPIEDPVAEVRGEEGVPEVEAAEVTSDGVDAVAQQLEQPDSETEAATPDPVEDHQPDMETALPEAEASEEAVAQEGVEDAEAVEDTGVEAAETTEDAETDEEAGVEPVEATDEAEADEDTGIEAVEASGEAETDEVGGAEPVEARADEDAGIEASEATDKVEETAVEASDTSEQADATEAQNFSEMMESLSDKFSPQTERHSTGDSASAAESISAAVSSSDDDDFDLDFDESATDPNAGETARMLLDIMSKPSGAAQPQERALAADTLLRLVTKIPVVNLIGLSDRICIMEQPPALLVNKLIRHPDARVAGPLLETCAAISDQVLLPVIRKADHEKRRMIARRNALSPALCDALLEAGDSSVFLTVVRNPGASLSHDAFITLSEQAKNQPSLQAPLVTRGDTPAPMAFELFWFLPSELRRYVLSRFLTDSETLNKILKIALAVDGCPAEYSESEDRFADPHRAEELCKLIEEGSSNRAAALLSELASINQANALRIISDPDGDPLTVAMKSLGVTRARFSDALKRWQSSPNCLIRAERPAGELQTLFDSLSFNKARVLLTYWDWAALESGPYARKAA